MTEIILLDNCRFIEKVENSAKDKRKIICQYDLQMNLLKEWESLELVSNMLKIQKSNISKVCAQIKRWRTAGGFIFRYKEI